uniref:ribosomal protein L20 n=1 Tax=Catenella fusiformis TaxID=3024791 RepID=UPI003002D216|nr:ribosomal protein L20 [Catenella fusiformis]
MSLNYKGRKLKKRFSNVKKINSSDIKYSVFHYFLQKENLILSRKAISYFLVTESGSLFSLKKWSTSFIHKSY